MVAQPRSKMLLGSILKQFYCYHLSVSVSIWIIKANLIVDETYYNKCTHHRKSSMYEQQRSHSVKMLF